VEVQETSLLKYQQGITWSLLANTRCDAVS
jgi:hypothetical protein